MRWFSKFVGKLPFAGKMLIRELVFGLYQSTSVAERRRSYLKIIIFLSFFVVFHGVQAQTGIQALKLNSPIWAKAISGIYALANIFVSLTQLQLGFRTTRFFFVGLIPRRKRSRVDCSLSEAAIMLAVTIGGQIIFRVTYNSYR